MAGGPIKSGPPWDLAIPLLGIWRKEMRSVILKHICLSMSTVKLLIIAEAVITLDPLQHAQGKRKDR